MREEAVFNALLGLLMTLLAGLVAWVFHFILKEMKDIRRKIARLSDAVFLLAARLHPENAEIILKTLNEVNRANGVNSSIMDDIT